MADGLEPRAPSLLDLLDDGAAATAHIVFEGAEPLALDRLWADCHVVGAALAGVIPEGASLGVVLDNSLSAVQLLLGGWLAGRRVVSLPIPARAQPLEDYLGFLGRASTLAGCAVVALPDDYAGFVPPDVACSHGDVLSGRVSPRTVEAGALAAGPAFVQFSSGSTRHPCGIVLDLDMLGANVGAILDRLQPTPGDSCCSWLPLSHDMGLIGMLLTPLAAAGRRWAGGGTIALSRPETFLADPLSWLRACAEHRATITAAPDFALRRVAERVAAYPSLDLRLDDLRVCITGAERVRHDTLSAFSAAVATLGASPDCPCPAYGLAEAALAVTMHAPGTPWEVVETSDGPAVSSGRPLARMSVRVDAGEGRTGELVVDGPSVSRRRLGEADAPPGPLRTGDLAQLVDGAIAVVSRLDEVVNLAGRRVHLPDIDDAASAEAGVRRGSAVAVPTAHHDGYSVTIEIAGGHEPDAVAARVRRGLSRRFGTAPEAVRVLDNGATPKTPSGKPQRGRAAHLAAI